MDPGKGLGIEGKVYFTPRWLRCQRANGVSYIILEKDLNSITLCVNLAKLMFLGRQGLVRVFFVWLIVVVGLQVIPEPGGHFLWTES
jgi:hypothetical protein